MLCITAAEGYFYVDNRSRKRFDRKRKISCTDRQEERTMKLGWCV